MDKASQRKASAAARAALTSARREELSRLICLRLLKLPEFEQAENILSYLAAGDEADMELFNERAAELGKCLAYPVSHRGGIMEAYVPGKLKKGRFGIREPEISGSGLMRPEDIDLVIAPCLAFDEKGGRLGHGCGYYDRYLPACTKAKAVLAAFEAQKLDRVVTDSLDRKMDMAVTEKMLYIF